MTEPTVSVPRTETVKIVTEVEITYSRPEAREYVIKAALERTGPVRFQGWGGSGNYSARSKGSALLDAGAGEKPERIWCAMCGKWGDHGSGSCPELEHTREPDPLMDCPLCGKYREHGHDCEQLGRGGEGG